MTLTYNPTLIAPEPTTNPALPLWVPHDYQEIACQFLLEKLLAQLWLSPGLGKTTIALACALQMLREGLLKRILIVAPLRVAVNTWPAEIQKWRNFAHLRYGVLHGTKKERIYQEKNTIDIINYDGLPWLIGKLKEGNPYDLVIFDEISKLKNPTTKRFQILAKVVQSFPLRWGLTGSPASNHLLNVWGPQYMIDGGYALSSNYYHFRDKYFYPPDFYNRLRWEMDRTKRFEWIPTPANHILHKKSAARWEYIPSEGVVKSGDEQIHEKMKDRALSMNALDHLKMPSLIHNTVSLDLPNGVELLYRILEKPWLYERDMSERDLIAATHGQIAQQLTSGVLYVPHKGDEYLYAFLEENPDIRQTLQTYPVHQNAQGRSYWLLHTEKLDATLELVEELQGAGALIAYQFDHELSELRSYFPDAPVLSKLKMAELGDVIHRWNRGEIPVLLCQPKSVGHGLNLQGHGAAVIWYSLTWSLEEMEQLEGRIWRQGQKNNTIMSHRLLVENSIDIDLLYALELKNQTQLNLIANASGGANEQEQEASFQRALEASKEVRRLAKSVMQTSNVRRELAKEYNS